jgi:cytoskeletal protein CcmA (bactofilin family)
MKGRTWSGKLDTYIGEETSFEGNLTSKQNLCVYGNVRGTIECQGRVMIGESGNVEADILANDVLISGKVVGNVMARGKLEMTPTGVIQGDVKTSRLIMEDGSKLDGHCEMLLDGKPAVTARVTDVHPALTVQEKPKLPSASRN